MPKRSSITVKTWLHSLEETMQPLEQFIIEATKQLFETSQQMHSNLEPVTTRSNWRQRLAQALIKIAQLLEPDSQTPIRSCKAKQ
jgi:hypothetical protein